MTDESPHGPDERRRWLALVVLSLSALVVSMDQNVLHLALPELSDALGVDLVQQLWVVDVYGLMVAVFLIPFGALADRLGHRRVLLLGAVGFATCSVLAAFAPTGEALIAARALLGVAGASLAPCALALITAVFPDAGERAKAVGIWMTCFMVGMAAGPVIGGLLLRWFWWGSVFLLAVPAMLVLLLAGPSLLPSETARRGGRIDAVGAALASISVLTGVYGIKELTAGGASPWLATGSLLLGIASAGAFARRLGRQPDPLIPVAVFHNRRFTASLCVMALTGLAIGGPYFFFAQYLQLVGDLSPLRAGAILIFPATAFAAGVVLGPVLAAGGLPIHTVLAGGLVVAAVGLATASFVRGEEHLLLALIGFSVAFLGFGPGAALGTDLIVGSAPQGQEGAASALSETGTELGQALGVAVLGSLGAAFYRLRLGTVVPPETGRTDIVVARDGVVAVETLVPELGAAAESAYATTLGWMSAVAACLVLALAVAAWHALRLAPTESASPVHSTGGSGIPHPGQHPSIAPLKERS